MLDDLSSELALEHVSTREDPVKSARSAKLTYVHPGGAGIRRVRAGKGFTYRGPSGKRVADARTLRRIAALRIPPAWKDVWICPSASGHLQATGHDERGRKQYVYHPRFREVREANKFARMREFGEAIVRIRAKTARDLGAEGRERVLAAVVRLLDATLIRVGNEVYARENRSFGLTTLRDRHVEVRGAHMEFHFRGKSGKEHRVQIDDRRLARVVRDCHELPGHELFQYRDAQGKRHRVGSADVNAYLRRITGEDFTAKDFRTWAGSSLALEALADGGAAESPTAAKRALAAVVRAVSSRLRNTPAVCRACYIHPAVIESYVDGSLHALELSAPCPAGLRSREKRLYAFLRRLEAVG